MRGLSTTNIHKEINDTLGAGTISERTCAGWVAKFKHGNFNAEDESRSGRPSNDMDEEIQAILDDNPRATTREIALELGVVKETVIEIG
jgi:transposase